MKSKMNHRISLFILLSLSLLLNNLTNALNNNNNNNNTRKTTETELKPPESILKCLTCKEMIWISAVNTDHQYEIDKTVVTETNLVSLIGNACKYSTWTRDYEVKYDVPRSEWYINYLNRKRKNSTWHDTYLVRGCQFINKYKSKQISKEFMKYVNNKQKLGNYVDTLQEIICSKLCNASKHGSFGKESVMEEVDEDNFMEDEIDNWEDP